MNMHNFSLHPALDKDPEHVLHQNFDYCKFTVEKHKLCQDLDALREDGGMEAFNEITE